MTDEDDAIETFYTEERWQNWIDRLREEDLDLEDEDSARLLMNLQEDTAIAVAKVLESYEEDLIDEERAHEELSEMQEIVLAEAPLEDDEKAMLLESVQMSLEVVFYAAQEYVAAGAADEASLDEYIDAAAQAEAEEDIDTAIGYIVQAGTLVVDGEEIDPALAEEMEYGLVAEWVNGLESLQNAMASPETVEEDD
ncbi:DUF2150 family protein [Halolamina salifodinae]|uniref:DUF2150 family protein n=1 Tax=Halolamina salifodinae TaxID=1202767 RepID=A0A8T4GSC7_9EURY|nr:DUF2150 family protein [Halolamina salifodinae]MBP1985756.1 hypothetical protein [Halolamina salifodinae]